jgi:uncharacterized protein (DUF2147 family)
MIKLVFMLVLGAEVSAQSVFGKWKTIDDATAEAKSVVEIYERKGKVYGQIIQTFPQPGEDPDPVCTKCDSGDERYKRKIIGMEIMKDLIKSGNEYKDGTILDQENGKVYRCKLWLEGNTLTLRGYWGPFWRTQIRVKAD